jgi:exo-beta-1,3-glucanase (GH17 family)
VDFIAIHVLPYWEKESIDAAVQTSLKQIARVQARFPDRKVVIAEIGWPSNGPSLGKARASAANQALFVRDSCSRQSLGLDYYLIEAFDQPWKMATEGRAGAYWGCGTPGAAQVRPDRAGGCRTRGGSTRPGRPACWARR